ncbi:hypothetical protein CHCC20441_0202 [Bacillus licheniformis]|nr:hypothetical protein MUY_004325 [Bacillus licheniformis WX-02]KYC78339.1 hypothetical protein B4090_4507 [Bacillus licheniformis]OLG05962.1 hypothetical protein B4124_1346 [Bacillus licheniformis]TWJ42688.1 hypothetical protein CHCC5026_0807 [Bacillus licheniformis]TWJ44762.1 hypothetical protein CHCC5025_2330 [Bacillus licheniformis]
MKKELKRKKRKAAARQSSRFFSRSIFICALLKLEHVARRFLFGAG